MNIKKFVGAAAIMVSVAAGTAAPAAAINNIKPFGTQMTLVDGANEIGYTVEGIGPSSETIPYPLAGRLFESTVTVNAVRGWVTPMVPYFNAVTEQINGQAASYRVLANVYTPQGLSGAQLPPGASSTGKIYFDVVGPDPTSVIYGDGAQAYMAWIP